MNDYCYVDLIDTVGYDTGLRLQEYYEFFNVWLPVTRDISKIKCIQDKIKYHYKKTDDFSTPGDSIMAYIFVFDYNERKSFKDILFLAKEIKFQEKLRLANLTQTKTSQKNQKTKSPLETIKIFVANKCPFLVEDDAPIQNKKKEIIYPIYKYDETAEYYLNETMNIYDNDKEVAMENLYFVNAKFNIGVDKVFRYMAKEVMQKEDLWKIPKYEEKFNKDHNKNNNLMDDVSQVSCFEMIFLCKCGKKTADEEPSPEEKEVNKSQSEENNPPVILHESEDNEVHPPDYNTNSSKQPNPEQENNLGQKEEEKKEEEEKKSSGCIIM